MILQEVILKGFGSYKDLTVIPIPLGLTGIVGEYESNVIKSVGAGKTTIVSALNYAFFGKGEFDKVEEIINDQLKPKEEFFVNIKFRQGNSLFEVERGRNPEAYLEFKENGVPRGDPKIDKRTEEIQQVIGMDYSMFTASIFFEQDRLSKLVDTDPSTRRNYIEKVLGINVWTQSSKQINRDKNILKKDLEILNKEIDALITIILSYEEELKKISSIDESLLLNTIKKEELELKIKEYSLLQQKSLDLIGLRNSKISLEDNLRVLKEKLAKLLEDQTKNIKSIDVLKNSLNADKNLYNSQIEDINIVTQVIEKIDATLDSNAKKELALVEKLSKYQQEKKTFNEIQSKLKEGICTTCGTSITEKTRISRMLEFSTKIEDVELSVLSLLDDKAILDKEKKENTSVRQENFKKLQSMQQELHQIRSSIELNERSISNLESKVDSTIFTELKDSYENSIKIITHDIKDTNKKIIKLEEETKNIAIDEFAKLEDNLKKVNEDILLLNQEKGVLKGIQTELDKRVVDRELKLKQLEEKEYELSLYNILEKEFDRIPSELLTSSVSCIEKEAEEIIQLFIPEMSISVSEDLTKVTRPLQVYFTIDGKRRNYKRLSGGQRTIANLALRLGFSKVISSRVGVQLGFLILDEPFAFLDNFNRDLVKKVLIELKKSFSQIIVISHVDNIQDFPNLIKVTMCEDNVSRILT